MTENDRRLIEDYLPIEKISAEASREKKIRKGHISTLHIWWARRPLVACRAAVYGTLVPAPASEDERRSRSNFVTQLCKYPGDPKVIAEAQRHILEAHAGRLTAEGIERAKAEGRPPKVITVKDIEEGRASRPKVLDMFAGGGAIPLEALRLGCEAYALDLNPVAYLIELCTLVYPQKYGKPDKNAKGSVSDGTWAGLAKEVKHWGKWVLERVKAEISDLYPSIPDPKSPPQKLLHSRQGEFYAPGFEKRQPELAVPGGYLTPVAYLWTRTVRCKNPICGATVPLYRQTWLRKKASGYVALRPYARTDRKGVLYELVSASEESALGFDPSEGSSGTATVCKCCGTTADAQYVRDFGSTQGFGQELMAVICTRPGEQGKVYLAAPELAANQNTLNALAAERVSKLEKELGGTSLDETIPPSGNAGLATGKSYLHGIITFRQAYTPRQLAVLLTLASQVRTASQILRDIYPDPDRCNAIAAYLGLLVSRLADRCCNLARWHNVGEKIEGFSSMKRYAMTWDFPEVNIFGGASGDAEGALEWITAVVESCAILPARATVARGTATNLPWGDGSFDAVITDPPYYDNESYSELSDMYYIWLKVALGTTFPEHFASALTPKRQEIVAAAYRFGGTKEAAERHYESQMEVALREANRVVRPGGSLVMVYAHKTTIGWATVVESVRRAGFSVVEAWPMDTEMATRVAHQEDAALASSIFLVARKREGRQRGGYEEAVQPELEAIIEERVAALWDQGITGADLVIACVGAGLRAFTRFARVEYANGEEVPAGRFLTEVETAVLDSILNRLSKEAGTVGQASLASVDSPTRFYTLWRYTYRTAELEAGEAIIFANGTHVELDGPGGLSAGARALIEKKKGKYRLRDYAGRGNDKRLGMPGDDGQPAPVIDTLHRTLWLMENRPMDLAEFLREAQPNREQMRLVAQALAGPALKGGELADVSPTGELAALARLTANWRSVVEDQIMPLFGKKEGQP